MTANWINLKHQLTIENSFSRRQIDLHIRINELVSTSDDFWMFHRTVLRMLNLIAAWQQATVLLLSYTELFKQLIGCKQQYSTLHNKQSWD